MKKSRINFKSIDGNNLIQIKEHINKLLGSWKLGVKYNW